MSSSSSYQKGANIFPNRPYWNQKGLLVSAPPIELQKCWCPTVTTPALNLCEQCQELRLRHLIFCEPEGYVKDLGLLRTMMGRPNCDLCSLIVLGCKQTWRDTEWEDESTGTETTCYLGALDVSRQQTGGYLLQVQESHMKKNSQWVEFEIVFKGHGATLSYIEKSVEVCPTVDVGMLKSSLAHCEAYHTSCVKEHESSSSTLTMKDILRFDITLDDNTEQQPNLTPQNMIVINVENMSIGTAPDKCRYVALSYVWGRATGNWLKLARTNVGLLAKTNSLVGARLPATVQDAIELCRALEERYLWVDSICIFQDNPMYQKQQVDIMDQIYARAALTIVAGAGDHANSGLPGISSWLRSAKRQTITIQDIEVSNTLPRLKDTAELSVWNTRGWTYQERIFSKRCIVLTEAQCFFTCPQGVRYERENRLAQRTHTIERFGAPLVSTGLIRMFPKSVIDYSRRSLTSQADILRAFQGVMNHMAKAFNQTFCYGIPCSVGEDEWTSILEDALLWQQAGIASVRCVPGLTLPTWSWVSIDGAVKYTFTEQRVTSIGHEQPAEWFTDNKDSHRRLQASWEAGEAPRTFRIQWFFCVEKSLHHSLSRQAGTKAEEKLEADTMLVSFPLAYTDYSGKIHSGHVTHQPPERICNSVTQKPGRIFFETQQATFNLRNSVPYDCNDSWWTDYTQDVDQLYISIASILPIPPTRRKGSWKPPKSRRTHNTTTGGEEAGFIELDRAWAEEHLTAECSGRNREWEFVAISLATSRVDDTLHRHLTQRRNVGFPRAGGRDVRQLIVNVMLIETSAGGVSRRLGVGKIYLDFWEEAWPRKKWIVLE